uniref:PIN domain-containing protein n=1 Tax=Candidatus Kentrum sp. SD TaxID=2126332 RepID=A0A450YGG8_9GAMM|nr:MAG: PIN domain-containing protein [Candidatus Kentron sp. SD]VFK46080.1 MAG: PIN domain-containing protein [Candidatus Kentron sp. SD]
MVSTQVLNEASNVWLKKYGLDIHQVKSYLKTIRKSAEVRLLNETLTFRALELFGRHKLSFYDSLIIAAALDAGCRTLYTEDLQHGQRIEKLTIEDPFRHENP